MTTDTTATPEEPENGEEPFALSEAEVTAISEATGVRADLIRFVKGETYAEVRDNAVKLHDLAPTSRTVPPVKPVENRDKLDMAVKLADAIRSRMNGTTDHTIVKGGGQK